MRRLVRELAIRSPLLNAVGWLHVALAIVFLALMPLDQRTILGLDPWVKPFKFATSIAVFVWTMAWLMAYLKPRHRWLVKALAGIIAMTMVIEIVCIAGQSWRGTTSHFNNATAVDAGIFSLMGTMIGINTVAVAVVLLLFFTTKTDLEATYLWGIRLGILLFLAGSAVGGQLVANRAHTIGAPDGGPGLPLVNWSTEAGDLRVAHGLGLHALQLLPLVGYLLGLSGRRVGVLCIVALVWAMAVVWAYRQATQGRPLLTPSSAHRAASSSADKVR